MTAVTLRLSKHHSSGNDFLVALVSELLPGSARGLFGDPTATAIALCHRRRGIGADGLVLGVESADQPRMLAGGDGGGDGEEIRAGPMSLPAGEDGGGDSEVLGVQARSVPMSAGGDGEALGVRAGPVRMRLWNSDGSEAETSGNGLRCLAQAVARSRGVSEIDIDTPTGPRRCRIEPDGEPGAGLAMGRVEMGAVTLDAFDCAVATARSDPDQLAAALDRVEGFTGRWRTGSVGNPHVVVEVADPDAVDLEVSGPTVEACFADGANVHFAAAVGFRQVRMRIWERGAGVTESCGSGAAVAAAVFDAWEAWADPDGNRAAAGAVAGSGESVAAGAARSGAVAGSGESAGSGATRSGAVVGEGAGNAAGEIVVAMPGGETRVHLGPSVALTGPVVHVADIEIPDVRLLC